LRLLTRAVTYSVAFGIGYGVGLGLSFGLASGIATGLTLSIELNRAARGLRVEEIIIPCLGKGCFLRSADSLSERDCTGPWVLNSQPPSPFSSRSVKFSPTPAACVPPSNMRRLAVRALHDVNFGGLSSVCRLHCHRSHCSAFIHHVDQAWFFALRVGLVTGIVTGVGAALNSYIEYYADNLPERWLGAFGIGLILCGFALQSLQYWLALFDVRLS